MQPTAHDHPFNEDNRAYRRFTTLAGEHFDVATVLRARDERPVMLTVTDVGSGDMFTLVVLESAENNDPHVLLAVAGTAIISAYGPFVGLRAADGHAFPTLLAYPDTDCTCGLPLHLPTSPTPIVWLDGPPDIVLRAADPDPAATAIVLLIDGDQVAAIGPFPIPAAADSWASTSPHGHLERLVLTLRPPVPDVLDTPPAT